MRLTAYVILLFSFSLVGYWLGYQPIGISALQDLYNRQGTGPLDYVDVLRSIGTAMLDPNGPIGVLGIAALTGIAVALISGYAGLYVLPLLMLVVVLNIFIIPTSYIVSPLIPDLIKIPILVFLNLVIGLMLVQFIRGGGV